MFYIKSNFAKLVLYQKQFCTIETYLGSLAEGNLVTWPSVCLLIVTDLIRPMALAKAPASRNCKKLGWSYTSKKVDSLDSRICKKILNFPQKDCLRKIVWEAKTFKLILFAELRLPFSSEYVQTVKHLNIIYSQKHCKSVKLPWHHNIAIWHPFCFFF